MASNSRSSNLRSVVGALVLATCLLSPAAAPAAADLPTVDAAIVLLTDVSRSIDDSEFQLEKQGYSAAFSDPRVVAAITGGPNARIAVTYLEFAGDDQVRTVVDWTVIDGAAAAAAFGGTLTAAPRSFYGRTAIGSGLIPATAALAEITTANSSTRAVIDVAGDGTSNAGALVTAARDQALAAGITINGLAIINDHPVSYTFAHVQPPGGLTQWYRDNVTGGPGSFALEVHDFHSFGEAMVRKLLSEIAALPHTHG
jgi:hypothetical protein